MTARPVPTLDLEHELIVGGARTVAGIDEVGRGALAGPVAVGVAVVDAATEPPPAGLADSKLLSARRREQLAPLLREWCVEHAIGWASAAEIDERGIVPALRLAAERALDSLAVAVDALILDGNHDWLGRAGTTVRKRADQTCASVSAASVIAKVARDASMRALHLEHPEFVWHSNKGYGAAVHLDALRRVGPSPHHRRSFRLG